MVMMMKRRQKEETETVKPNQAVAGSKRHRHSQLGPASTSSTQADDRRRAGGLGRVGGGHASAAMGSPRARRSLSQRATRPNRLQGTPRLWAVLVGSGAGGERLADGARKLWASGATEAGIMEAVGRPASLDRLTQ